MNLIEQVYGSLRWKKNDSYCAAKLGISLEKYQSIKSQILQVRELLQGGIENSVVDITGKRMLELVDDETILNNYISDLEEKLVQMIDSSSPRVIEMEEDLQTGEGKIKVLASVEPKSPEEVEELVKIKDSPKWILSHYYNKQQPNGLWMITALVSRKKLDEKHLLQETLKNFKPKYQPIDIKHINPKFCHPVAAVISLQDLHFGKENNEDIIANFKDTLTSLTYRAYGSHSIDKIYYVIGGDLLNMDTFNGSTTKGTPVHNSTNAQEAYDMAFEALHWSVSFLKQFCNTLEVVYIPGNHDRLSSYHMAHALSKCFKDKDIKFHTGYGERKVFVYGNNFFAFEHGDVSKKTTPLVYATEFPIEWGKTVYRSCYTGHYHSRKTTEFISENEIHGFSIKQLPSLSGSDYYHYHNKFTGSKRQGVVEIHHMTKGKICEFIHTV